MQYAVDDLVGTALSGISKEDADYPSKRQFLSYSLWAAF